MPTVNLQSLTKQFGSTEALSESASKLEYGEVFSLLGPNVAGKSATITFSSISPVGPRAG